MPACRHLTPNELSLLTSNTNSLHNLLINLGCVTGYRISELLSVKVEQVYRDGIVSDYVCVEKEHMKGRNLLEADTSSSPKGQLPKFEWLSW